MRHDWEDLLRTTLGQEVLDPVDREEDVRVLGLPEAVKQERQVVVVVEAVDGNLKIGRSFSTKTATTGRLLHFINCT